MAIKIIPTVTSSDILEGIKSGIVPDKPTSIFGYFKEQLNKVTADIDKYREIMQEKHGISRKEYLVYAPPGAERRLAYELGERYIRLFGVLHRYSDEIISGEIDKYRRRPHARR